MSTSGSLELAAARLGARWGRRADEATWRRVESARSLAGALDVVQGSGLAPWTEGLTATSPPHAIEQALRRRHVRFVQELAGWMPAPWQAAVLWCAVLPELPLLRHLAAGESAPPWLDADPARRGRWPDTVEAASTTARTGLRAHPFASPHGAVRASAQAAIGPPGELPPSMQAACAALRAKVGDDPGRVLDAWQAHWHRVAPPGAARDAIEAVFGRLWQAQRGALAQPGADPRALRHALASSLLARWRRALLEPLAAFVHVALLTLEFERLRGELVGRAAFPGLPVLAQRTAPPTIEAR